MKFGSVCTGIGAAEGAWKELGWEPAWVSEIEPYPCAVLAHRQDATAPQTIPTGDTEEEIARWINARQAIERNIPKGGTVPNLGDMTRIHEKEEFRERSIDLLVGGTPCQSFSVAGLRKGLADPRGNLALVFLGLVDRSRPRWVVWENVPGVLSSWSDEAVVNPPQGFERDLDEARADADHLIAETYGAGGDARECERARATLGRALAFESFEEAVQSADFDAFTSGLAELGYGVAWAVLDAQHFGVPQRRRRVFVVGYLGDYRPAAAVLLDAHCLSGHPAPCRATRQGTLGPAGGGAEGSREQIGVGGGTAEGTAATLKASGNLKLAADHETYVAHTLRGEGFDASEDGTGRGIPIVPIQEVGKRTGKSTDDPRNGVGIGDPGDPMYTLQAGAQHGVIVPEEPVVFTEQSQNQDAAPTLTASGDRGRNAINHPCVAFSSQGSALDAAEDICPTIRKGGDGGGVQPAVAQVFDMRGNGDGKIAPTLTRNAAGDRPSDMAPMVFSLMPQNSGKDFKAREAEVAQPLIAGGPTTGNQGGDIVFDPNQITSPANRSNPKPGDPCHTIPATTTPPMLAGATVRRLTVVECERLQSFPDNYTLIPWDAPPRDEVDRSETVSYLIAHGHSPEAADAIADTPDGHRYKGLGNSMNRDVMLWIGKRIVEVEAVLPKKERRIWP